MLPFEDLNDDILCEIVSRLDNYNDLTKLFLSNKYFLSLKDLLTKFWIQTRQPFLLEQNDGDPQIEQLIKLYTPPFMNFSISKIFNVTITGKGTPRYPYGQLLIRLSFTNYPEKIFLLANERNLTGTHLVNEILFTCVEHEVNNYLVRWLKIKLDTKTKKDVLVIEESSNLRFTISSAPNPIIYSKNNDWYEYILTLPTKHPHTLISIKNFKSFRDQGNNLIQEYETEETGIPFRYLDEPAGFSTCKEFQRHENDILIRKVIEVKHPERVNMDVCYLQSLPDDRKTYIHETYENNILKKTNWSSELLGRKLRLSNMLVV